MKELRDIRDEYVRCLQSGQKVALATVQQVTGSAYRRPGTHMLVREDGFSVGSVSGGCLERQVIEECLSLLNPDNDVVSKMLHFDTNHDDDTVFGWASGCPGTVTIRIENLGKSKRAFLQELPKSIQLIIFGGGYDSCALVELAKAVGFDVTICEHRRAFADASRFPLADKVIHYRPEATSTYPELTESFCIVMSHNYLVDQKVLSFLLHSNSRYVGVLGPKKRTQRMLQQLKNEGVDTSPAALEKLYAPIGLDIGAESPDQIALSILAEIQTVLAGRKGGFLRDRDLPIHDPLPLHDPLLLHDPLSDRLPEPQEIQKEKQCQT